MTAQWQFTVWGVRGSFPRAMINGGIYGGNTSCFSVDCGGTPVILDAGSGLTALGKSILSASLPKRLDVLITHLHLDHLLGLFTFLPVFRQELEIHFYGFSGFRHALETLMGQPYWPVGFDDFPTRISFHEVSAGNSFHIGSVQVDTMEGAHPGGSLYYRLEGDGKRLVYALDCEPPDNLFREKLADFARGSDLLVWDACYTSDDLRPGWGHSTWEQGLAMRQSAGAKRILMAHYNWEYPDDLLAGQESLAKQRDAGCEFAKEGMVIHL